MLPPNLAAGFASASDQAVQQCLYSLLNADSGGHLPQLAVGRISSAIMLLHVLAAVFLRTAAPKSSGLGSRCRFRPYGKIELGEGLTQRPSYSAWCGPGAAVVWKKYDIPNAPQHGRMSHSHCLRVK